MTIIAMGAIWDILSKDELALASEIMEVPIGCLPFIPVKDVVTKADLTVATHDVNADSCPTCILCGFLRKFLGEHS